MAVQSQYCWSILSGVAINHMEVHADEVQQNNEKIPLVFVIIPGNPGCIQFYEKFAESLFSLTDVPVYGVSHTGHAQRSADESITLPGTLDCGLEKQIEHKIQYLRQEVLPKFEKVILIGHSIGCYIILHVMDRMKEEQASFEKGILLFPTIERIAQTPQGLKITPLLSNSRWLFSFVVGLLRFLPDSVISWLASVVTKSNEECVRKTIVNHFTVPIADCCSYMALHEMYEVNARNDAIIETNINKLIFYYGAKDHWCPVSYYEDMLKAHGHREGSNILLCKNGYQHAFLLKNSLEVANLVANWTSDLVSGMTS